MEATFYLTSGWTIPSTNNDQVNIKQIKGETSNDVKTEAQAY